MSKTYCMCQGMRGEATRRGGNAGVHVAAQSYDGSIICYNWYEGDTLMVEVGTSDRSSCCINDQRFRGTFKELNQALELLTKIKRGELTVVAKIDK